MTKGECGVAAMSRLACLIGSDARNRMSTCNHHIPRWFRQLIVKSRLRPCDVQAVRACNGLDLAWQKERHLR